jgi:C4-dicarboxylate transporter DctM subunit
MILTFSSFLLLVFSGIPIVFALGVAATVTLVATTDVPLSIVAQRVYGGLDSFPLMAIPFFVLAGVIMEVGGIARRFVSLATALVGWVTGSLLMVAVVTTAGLSAISGSGSADTAAVGSILIPEMRKRGYHADFSAAMVAAGGGLGPIIPPSIIMVVIAIISNLSIGAMFLGGIVPGFLMAMGLLFVGWLHARKGGPQYEDVEPFSLGRLRDAFVDALPALTLPVIIVGGIIGGVVTATEASCLAVICGLIIARYIYRELGFVDLPDVILRAVGLSSAVMIIVATASVFSWLVASQGVPRLLAGWLQGVSSSATVFLLIVNALLLVVGMFMESASAILILMPVLMPIAVGYGLDPVHFGVVVALNLSIGLVTPPYGICLFVASVIAKRSVAQISHQIWKPLVPMILVLFLATYVSDLIMWLPNAVLK